MELPVNVSFDNTEVAFSSKTDRQLKRANLIFSIVNIPWLSQLAQQAAIWAMRLRLPVTSLIRRTVYNHFCGGENADQVEETIQFLKDQNMNVILHYSVEGIKSEEGYEKTVEGTLQSIAIAGRNTNVPFCVLKITGICTFDLLQKLQEKMELNSVEEQQLTKLEQQLFRICDAAAASGVSLFIDAEETWIQSAIDTLAYKLMYTYNRQRAVVYNTFQFYRKDMLGLFKIALKYARAEGFVLGAKIVRGAYMEQERERARMKGYESLIQDTKESTDHDFNEALKLSITHRDNLSVVCGSHNEYSNRLLLSLLDQAGINLADSRFWFAQLYGMSDNISFNLSQAGCRVAKYLPYGPLRSVMPYLIRRARENTSVAHQSSRELLLVRAELRRRSKADD